MKFFNEVFPDFAELETKIFFLSENREVLIEGRYLVLESYCSNPKCDCLSVFLVVVSPDDKASGFDYSFDTNKLIISDRLNENGYVESDLIKIEGNSIYTDDIFDILEKKILRDKFYIDRLKMHYKMMKYKKEDIVQDNIIFLDSENNADNMIEKFNLTKKQEKERNSKKLAKKQRQRNRK